MRTWVISARSARMLAGITQRLQMRITTQTIEARSTKGAPIRQIGAPAAVMTISSLSPFMRSSV